MQSPWRIGMQVVCIDPDAYWLRLGDTYRITYLVDLAPMKQILVELSPFKGHLWAISRFRPARMDA